jgi:hypothetical protein
VQQTQPETPGTTPGQPIQPPPPPPPQAESSGGIGTLRIAGFVTTGVGLALLGGGLVVGGKMRSKEDEADKLCDTPNMVCDPKAEPLYNDAESLAKTANALFISGGVVTAVGLGLVIFGGPSSSKPAQASVKPFRVTPVLGAGIGGVIASGSF